MPGFLTKDEARELLGMEPCKTGGDCFKITISDMFIGSNDDPAEVTTDLMQESTDVVEVTDDEDTGGMLSMSDRREYEEKIPHAEHRQSAGGRPESPESEV